MKIDVFAWFVGRVTLHHCVIIVMKRACAMVYAIFLKQVTVRFIRYSHLKGRLVFN